MPCSAPSYPRPVAGARRKNVVLIIVDSLRADRMQVYGYQRETTPFLSALVQSGRMKKVEAAFSSCSESFCGITSTLPSRDFRDISARTFQLQDVLRDQGYQTWFLLSGNHRAWNGLPLLLSLRTTDTFFDGSQTQRYTMDDDRLVLEGLERVPPASPGSAGVLLRAPDVARTISACSSPSRTCSRARTIRSAPGSSRTRSSRS